MDCSLWHLCGAIQDQESETVLVLSHKKNGRAAPTLCKIRKGVGHPVGKNEVKEPTCENGTWGPKFIAMTCIWAQPPRLLDFGDAAMGGIFRWQRVQGTSFRR